MKRLFLLAIAVAVLAAFFASAYPDGLDSIAQKLGFSGKSIEHAAPMTGYGMKWLPEGCPSTAVAGIAGILLIFGIFGLIAFALKKFARKA